jgi:hypothetical protein
MSYKTAHKHTSDRSSKHHGRKLLGLGLLALAVIWAISTTGWSIAAIDWSALIWPIVIAIAGTLVMLGGSHRGNRRQQKHGSAREEVVSND